MTMQYPFILPCPICGETPKTYEYTSEYSDYIASCPNCGCCFDDNPGYCEHPAAAWNESIRDWFKRHIPPKKCPNCGNNNQDKIEIGATILGYYLVCTECDHHSPYAATIPAALVAWNKQPEPENVTTQDKEADQ